MPRREEKENLRCMWWYDVLAHVHFFDKRRCMEEKGAILNVSICNQTYEYVIIRGINAKESIKTARVHFLSFYLTIKLF